MTIDENIVETLLEVVGHVLGLISFKLNYIVSTPNSFYVSNIGPLIYLVFRLIRIFPLLPIDPEYPEYTVLQNIARISFEY